MTTLLDRMRELQTDPDRYHADYAPPEPPPATWDEFVRQQQQVMEELLNVTVPSADRYNRMAYGAGTGTMWGGSQLVPDPTVPPGMFYFVDDRGERTGATLRLPPPEPEQTDWQISVAMASSPEVRQPVESRPAHYRVLTDLCACGFNVASLACPQDVMREHLDDTPILGTLDGVSRRWRVCERCGQSTACREGIIVEPTRLSWEERPLSPYGPTYHREYHCDACANRPGLPGSDARGYCQCNRVFPAFQRCQQCGGLPNRRRGLRDRRVAGGFAGLRRDELTGAVPRGESTEPPDTRAEVGVPYCGYAACRICYSDPTAR